MNKAESCILTRTIRDLATGLQQMRFPHPHPRQRQATAAGGCPVTSSQPHASRSGAARHLCSTSPRTLPQGLPQQVEPVSRDTIFIRQDVEWDPPEEAPTRWGRLVKAVSQSVVSGPFEAQPHPGGHEHHTSRLKRRGSLESCWSRPVRGAHTAGTGGLSGEQKMEGVFPVGAGGGGLAGSREPTRWATAGSHVLRGSPPSCFWFYLSLASAKETSWDSRSKDAGWGLSGAGCAGRRSCGWGGSWGVAASGEAWAPSAVRIWLAAPTGSSHLRVFSRQLWLRPHFWWLSSHLHGSLRSAAEACGWFVL